MNRKKKKLKCRVTRASFSPLAMHRRARGYWKSSRRKTPLRELATASTRAKTPKKLPSSYFVIVSRGAWRGCARPKFRQKNWACIVWRCAWSEVPWLSHLSLCHNFSRLCIFIYNNVTLSGQPTDWLPPVSQKMPTKSIDCSFLLDVYTYIGFFLAENNFSPVAPFTRRIHFYKFSILV